MSRGRPLPGAAVVLAPVGIALAWLGLTAATGLNYHLLPLATAAAPSFALLRHAPMAAPGWRVALAALWGATVASVALLLLAAAGSSLDPAPVLVALVTAGSSIGAWWARRRSRQPAS